MKRKISIRAKFCIFLLPIIAILILFLARTIISYREIERDLRVLQIDTNMIIAEQEFARLFIQHIRQYWQNVLIRDTHHQAQLRTAEFNASEALKRWKTLVGKPRGNDDEQEQRNLNLNTIARTESAYAEITRLGNKIVATADRDQPGAIRMLRENLESVVENSTIPQIEVASVRAETDVRADLRRLSAAIKNLIFTSREIDLIVDRMRLNLTQSVITEEVIILANRELKEYVHIAVNGNGEDVTQLGILQGRIKEALDRWPENSDKGTVPKPPEELYLLTTIQTWLDRTAQDVLNLVISGKRDQAITLVTKQMNVAALSSPLVRAHEFVQTKHVEIVEDIGVIQTHVDRAYWTMWCIIVLVVLGAMSSLWLLSRRIIHPILELQKASLLVGSGNLDTHVEVHSQDELGQLEESFNSMVETRKETERSLRAVQERMQFLLSATPAVIYSANTETFGTTFISENVCPLIGYEATEFIEDPQFWKKHVHPDDREEFLRGTKRLLEEGRQEVEYRFLDRDGRYRWMRTEVRLVKDSSNKPREVVGYWIDVSQQKEAQEAIRNSEEKYRNLFETSQDAIFISTPEGKFIDVNPACVKLFDYSSKEELLAIDIPNDLYCNAQDRKDVEQLLQQQGFIKDYEMKLRRKDGRKLDVVITTSRVSNENGITYRGILRDVTHLKQLQSQLIESQRMKTVGQLAKGIAHEFNNALMIIITYCDLLMIKLDSDSSFRQYVTQILKSARDSARLTHELLAFGQKQVLMPERIGINGLLEKMSSLLRQLVGVNISLNFNLQNELGVVKVDRLQLEQVIIDLVVNAINALPNGGSIVFETANAFFDEIKVQEHNGIRPGHYVRLSIRDNGCGMDETTRSRIFDPFFTTQEQGRGSGLGLSIVHGIIQQSGGVISVESNSKKGSTFHIYLPRVEIPSSMHPNEDPTI